MGLLEMEGRPSITTNYVWCKNPCTNTGFVQIWNLTIGFLDFCVSPFFFRQSHQDELTNIIASIHPKVGLQYWQNIMRAFSHPISKWFTEYSSIFMPRNIICILRRNIYQNYPRCSGSGQETTSWWRSCVRCMPASVVLPCAPNPGMVVLGGAEGARDQLILGRCGFPMVFHQSIWVVSSFEMLRKWEFDQKWRHSWQKWGFHLWNCFVFLLFCLIILQKMIPMSWGWVCESAKQSFSRCNSMSFSMSTICWKMELVENAWKCYGSLLTATGPR